LLAAFGCTHLDASSTPFGEELAERRRVPGLPRDDDLRWNARRGAVVLQEKGLEHGSEVLSADVLEVERVAVDHLPVPQREDLHHGPVGIHREPDHVDRSDGAEIRRLPLGEVLDAPEAIAIARGFLETLVCGSLLHLSFELTLDRL